MDKCVFLYRRKPGLTRQEFVRHYADVHTPLGLRLVRNLAGYTTNFVESESTLDAVTEIWTPPVAGQPAPSTRYDSEADAATLRADSPLFIDQEHKEGWQVEERVVRHVRSGAAPSEQTADAKFVWFYEQLDDVPEPPPGAHRVVDQPVVREVYPGSRRLAMIRMAWAFDAADLGVDAASALAVREHRHILLTT